MKFLECILPLLKNALPEFLTVTVWVGSGHLPVTISILFKQIFNALLVPNIVTA